MMGLVTEWGQRRERSALASGQRKREPVVMEMRQDMENDTKEVEIRSYLSEALALAEPLRDLHV